MDANTTTEQPNAGARAPVYSRVLDRLPTVAIALGGFVTFTGNSYIENRFRAFGLDSGMLSLCQGYIICKGVTAAVGGIGLVIWNVKFYIVLGIGIAVALGAVGVLAASTLRRHTIWPALRAAYDFINRCNPIILKVCIVGFATGAGLVAGSVGAEYDTRHISDAIRNGVGNIYTAGTRQVCGLPLGQDPTTSVFVTLKGVSLVRTQEITNMRATKTCIERPKHNPGLSHTPAHGAPAS